MSVLQLLGFGPSKSAGNPGPLEDFWYMGTGRKTHAGVDVDEYTANNYSACWAATRILSATGACLPLHLKEETEADTSEVRREHPVHRAIHLRPNPEMGSMSFRSVMIDWQVNWGNAYAEIARRGSTVELWPIHPSRVEICRDKTSNELYYSVKNENGDEPTDIRANEMLHIRSVRTKNGITGMGVVEHARESIGFGQAVEIQGSAYFKNGGRPLVVIRGGKFKDNAARAFYRDTWAEIHAGPQNNAKPALLPDGAEINTLQFSAEDSQFLQTREHNIENIARWYGVPPHMIADLRRATFSNIEHMAIEFVVYSLVPWLKIWEEEIRLKLLTEREQRTFFAKHNIEGLLRGDSKARAEFYKSLFGIGVLSVNEIRRKEDMNPVDGGEQRFVPLNMAPLDQPFTVDTGADSGDTEPAINPEAAAKLVEYMEGRTLEECRQQAEVIRALIINTEPKRDTSAIQQQTAYLWLRSDVARMLKREKCDILHAVKKESNFINWMDSYYEKFSMQFRDEVQAASLAAAVSAELLTARHVAKSKDILLNAADGDASTFANRVKHILSTAWDSRAANMELSNEHRTSV